MSRIFQNKTKKLQERKRIDLSRIAKVVVKWGPLFIHHGKNKVLEITSHTALDQLSFHLQLNSYRVLRMCRNCYGR